MTIRAKTTYIIALYTDAGCADDARYFASHGIDNGPLHAPQSSRANGNGVYVYGDAPAFPSSSLNASNYWVDLSFSPASGGTTTQTASVWSASDTPSRPWIQTAGPFTVGTKFRADVDGVVSGARFYKGSGNTGQHVGLLYSADGALLAQATFSNESASGWQEVSFSNPVAITANTTYIIAPYTTGGCAHDQGYFTTAGVDRAPLHALKSGVDGGNGVYTPGTAPAFPAYSYSDANYWVDVVFSY